MELSLWVVKSTCLRLGVRVSESAGVRVRVCGCQNRGVRESDFGCAEFRVRVCGCLQLGVQVS
jgi:hypothetical protein